jgi:hypothetical protein
MKKTNPLKQKAIKYYGMKDLENTASSMTEKTARAAARLTNGRKGK